MDPTVIEIDAPVYRLPSLDYDVLRVTTGDQRSTSERNQVVEVEVPEGGVLIEFLSGGGKLVAPPLQVMPKPKPKPKPVVKPEVKHDSKQPVPGKDPKRPGEQKSDEVQQVEQPSKSDG